MCSILFRSNRLVIRSVVLEQLAASPSPGGDVQPQRQEEEGRLNSGTIDAALLASLSQKKPL